VKDPDPTTSVSDADDLRDRLWAYEDFSAVQEHPSIDVTGAFASLGFLRAALRRSRRFWLLTGAIGFLVGCGLYVGSPPPYSASTTLLLTNAPGTDPATAMLTEQSLAASLPVATAVVKQLGLTGSPGSLLAGYTATPVSDQVLKISVSAPSSTQAVQWAQAIGTQFLKFRANLLTTQEQQQEATLSMQVARAQTNLNALGAKITSLGGTIPSLSSTSPSTSPSATTPTGQVGKLAAQYLDSDNKLNLLTQQVAGTNAQNQVYLTSQIDGSQVLDPASLGTHSKLKYIAFDIVAALFGGLVIGMAIVVVRALISDRLRRRDDISLALGVPVKLSVGAVKRARFSLNARMRKARRSNLRRVAMYLRIAAPRKDREDPRTLAVLPVDNTKTMVPVVAWMAESCAKDGMRIVVADLVKGSPLARALGAGGGAGIKSAQVDGARVVVVVPEPDDIAPAGPLRPAGAAPLAPPPSEDLLSAFRSADLLVTFVELDPALGSEHLATWATDGVAIVTAGVTHGQKAYSVGELLRMSGVHVGSAVLVDADESDDSLGIDPSLQEFMAGNS
jgi:capsular polysaccharide biosynthesis protein